MTMPERFPPDDPREWLNRAGSNLAVAKSDVAGAYLEEYCYNAQQAAEKAIKAVMILRDIEFPYTHNLRRLLDVLESSGETVSEQLRRAEELTEYATVLRYPIDYEEVSEEACRDLVAIAESVVLWAEEIIGYKVTGKEA